MIDITLPKYGGRRLAVTKIKILIKKFILVRRLGLMKLKTNLVWTSLSKKGEGVDTDTRKVVRREVGRHDNFLRMVSV